MEAIFEFKFRTLLINYIWYVNAYLLDLALFEHEKISFFLQKIVKRKATMFWSDSIGKP